MLVKPAPGLKIRDPDLKDLIPDEGRDVPETSLYWHRRLRDGDVVLVTISQTKKTARTEA